MNPRPPIRRRVLALAGALLSLNAVPGAWAADPYPSRTINLVVPYAPGGSTDLLARQYAQSLGRRLGQTIAVHNKPGANGNIGGMEVVRAKPDGYTLLFGDLTLATNPSLVRDMPFQPMRDLTPIVPVGHAPLALLVNPNKTPFKSVRDLIDFAHAHPGELTNGTAGNGNLGHLGFEVFKLAAKVEIRQVPYKGSGPAVTDLAGGQISMVMTGLSGTEGYLESGHLRALAITGTERSQQYPQIPTLSEATGLPLPELNLGSWWGVFGPAGLATDVVARLNEASIQAISDPETVARLHRMNARPSPGSPQVLREQLKSETETWGRIIRQIGLQPN